MKFSLLFGKYNNLYKISNSKTKTKCKTKQNVKLLFK